MFRKQPDDDWRWWQISVDLLVERPLPGIGYGRETVIFYLPRRNWGIIEHACFPSLGPDWPWYVHVGRTGWDEEHECWVFTDLFCDVIVQADRRTHTVLDLDELANAFRLGLVSAAQMRRAIAFVFGAALLVGGYLVAVGGWPIAVVGALSIAAGLAYTGGPFPYGYHGLGDVAVFVFFGPIAVGGTHYVQALSLSPVALAAALPVGALVTALLVVNNLRDIETDARAGKRTLAVRIGPRATRIEFIVLLVSAYALVPDFWLLGAASHWVLLPLLTLPVALGLARGVTAEAGGPALNAALAKTAQLAFVFSLLFAVGWVL